MTERIHLVGIGGAGLSAIATVLLQQGFHISGSDMQNSEAVERLRQLGAQIVIGHDAANIEQTQPDLIIISSAIPAYNPELVAANARHIPVYKRPTWLGQMMAGQRAITIAGTHGKTTTTAMVAFILAQAGLSPTYIIGGYSPDLQSNAAAGQSNLFVIEADEYDHTFLSLQPEIAVITNIEWDHPDIYPTAASYDQAFIDFVKLVPPHGRIIVCGDDVGVQRLIAQMPRAITYGLGPHNDWQAINLKFDESGCRFEVVSRQDPDTSPPLVQLKVGGAHNVRNALAAIVVADRLGIPAGEAAAILSAFSGTDRRFEIKGEVNGVTIIDDYGHHPTAVAVNLATARTQFKERPIWAVLQPHSFSRTKLLLHEFAAAFAEANHVLLLDIYPAREKDDGTVHSKDIYAHMQHPDARYIGGIPEATDYLRTHLTPGDVLITFSAGDGYKVGEELMKQVEKKL